MDAIRKAIGLLVLGVVLALAAAPALAQSADGNQTVGVQDRDHELDHGF
ncbi:MAG TPA: hypothetical protein VGZ23_01815 [bacterium]|nr:hypothetical protein [bacterium]